MSQERSCLKGVRHNTSIKSKVLIGTRAAGPKIAKNTPALKLSLEPKIIARVSYKASRCEASNGSLNVIGYLYFPGRCVSFSDTQPKNQSLKGET